MLKGIIMTLDVCNASENASEIIPFPDLIADKKKFIATCKEQGIKIAFVLWEDVVRNKENPYIKALWHLGLTCKECIAIADSDNEVSRAREAGLPVIGYENPYVPEARINNASYIITGFEEIDFDYLEQVCKRELGQPLIILETKRCIVREMTLEDLNSLYEIYHAPEITRYMENLYADREKEAAYMVSYIKNMYGYYGYGMWVVLDKETDRIIGRAGFENREGFQDLELGYLIAVEYQQKGYAGEVCNALLEYAKDKLECKSVHLLVDKENVPSIRLCTKLGFYYKKEVLINNVSMQMYQLELV